MKVAFFTAEILDTLNSARRAVFVVMLFEKSYGI
jgi:hypothetical protein